MSYTLPLWIKETLLVLVVVSVFIVTCLPPTQAVSRETPLGIEFDNEISLDPTVTSLISDYGSELLLSYETELFEIKTSTEFDLEGISGEELLAGLTRERVEAELELVFDPENAELESYEVKGDLQLSPETLVGLEYESDYSPEGGKTDGELVLTFDRELSEEVSVEVEGTFLDSDWKTSPAPQTSVVDVAGIKLGELTWDATIELSKAELTDIELDFDGNDFLFHRSGSSFSGSLAWELSESFIELEPEFELELGTFYVDTVLRLEDELEVSKLELVEAGISNLEIGQSTLDLSTDLDSGQTTATLERKRDKTEVEFELELESGKSDIPLNLDQFTGEFTWEPDDFLTVTFEMESDISSPPELTLASGYEF
ncbi:MAG: hypothetical protein ABEJ25_05530 [Candidatus Bipolaricaulia bacterium]